MALRHRPTETVGVLSRLADRKLRRRFPARRVSRCAPVALSTGIAPF